jgi:hypothetical protein
MPIGSDTALTADDGMSLSRRAQVLVLKQSRRLNEALRAPVVVELEERRRERSTRLHR